MARTDLKAVARQVSKRAKEPKKKKVVEKDTVPSGVTILNCALSDGPLGGYKPGTFVNIVGDNHTGKTILALTGFAEMSMDERFDGWDLIYDDAEAANSFAMERMFGPKLVKRLKPPYPEREFPNSITVEEFHDEIFKRCATKKPFAYILDSLDKLSSEAEMARLEDERKQRAKGKEPKGSFKTEKSRRMGELFREITDKMQTSKGLLIVISQTRDEINPLSFKKKRRASAAALDFYAHHIFWLAKRQSIKVTKNEKPRTIGSTTAVKVTKNKLTGKILREVTFDIYYDYGVDDIGSSINWLTSEKFWKGDKKIKAVDLKMDATRKKLIADVEKQGKERRLQRIVGRRWRELEESLKLGRKRRFE